VVGISERKHSARPPRTWMVLLLLGGLLLATSWDADGNPNTDNLPQIALQTGIQVEADVEVRVEDSSGETSDTLTFFARVIAQRLRILREWIWRPVALPARGP
jgi:hypothetical protein